MDGEPLNNQKTNRHTNKRGQLYLSRGKAPRKQLPKQARTKPHQFHSVVGQVAEKEENTWENSFHIGGMDTDG